MATPHISGVAALIIGQHGGSMDPVELAVYLRVSVGDFIKPGKDAW